jgi:hypothetical protein
MAIWFRKPWGWVRKGADAITTALGYGSSKYGESPYGE